MKDFLNLLREKDLKEKKYLIFKLGFKLYFINGKGSLGCYKLRN